MLKTITNFSFLILLNFCFSQDKSKQTEVWEPLPKKIEAYDFSKAPSDAVILFDGKDFSNWITQYSNETPKWKINSDGSMTVVNGTGRNQNKRTLWFCSATY